MMRRAAMKTERRYGRTGRSPYAIVHIVKKDGTKVQFPTENDLELGNTLNMVQGAIITGEVVKAHVEPIAEESKFKAEMFNAGAEWLESDESTE